MSEQTQLILWAVAVYAPLALNILTNRDADSIGASGLLVAGWCFSRLVALFYTVPDSMRFYPLQDALCLVVVFCALLSHRTWLKLALTCLFMLQLCLHAAFWYAWEQGRHDALPFYREMNNGIFALELLAVSWGAIVDVASHAFRRMPHWGGGIHLHKAGS